MPITSGAYVNPGFANGTAPAINATELNAMGDTLECVPVVNGGTGQTEVTSVTEGQFVVHKWGKLVMCQYKCNSRCVAEENYIPEGYEPASVVYLLAPGFSSTNVIERQPITYAKIRIGTDGAFNMNTYNQVSAYVYFTACWLTA